MTDETSTTAAERWLNVHTERAMLDRAPAAFASLTDSLPGDQQVASVPATAIVGGGAVDYAAADDAVTAAKGDVGKLTKVLEQNPIVGCTTVMDIALKSSGFNPLLPATAGNYAKYIDYVNTVVTAPFFHLNYADKKNVTESSSDWDSLLTSIADMFDAVTSEDKTRIVKGLQQLAHAATSTKDTAETLNVFSQSAIAQNTSEIAVAIYYSNVEMIEHDGKHTTTQSTFTVNRASINFRLDQWPIFAASVARTQVSRVDDWLTNNTSTSAS